MNACWCAGSKGSKTGAAVVAGFFRTVLLRVPVPGGAGRGWSQAAPTQSEQAGWAAGLPWSTGDPAQSPCNRAAKALRSEVPSLMQAR